MNGETTGDRKYNWRCIRVVVDIVCASQRTPESKEVGATTSTSMTEVDKFEGKGRRGIASERKLIINNGNRHTSASTRMKAIAKATAVTEPVINTRADQYRAQIKTCPSLSFSFFFSFLFLN